MGPLTTYKISFICFLDLFAASLIVPLMNNYLRAEIKLSNFVIGIISSTFSLLQIMSAPTVGYLSDLHGRKNILLSCLFVCVLCYFLLGVFKNVFVIVLVRILLGVFKHTQVICKAFISDICADSTKAYSQLMMVTFLGFFIGPALGGHIITYENGFMYICWLSSSVFLLTFVYAYFVVYDVEKREPSTGGTEEAGQEGDSLLGEEFIDGQLTSNSENSGAPFKSKDTAKAKEPFSKDFISYCKETFNIEWSRYWGIFLIKFLYALSMSLFYSNYISVLTHNFESSSQITGYTVSFQGLIGSFANFFINIKHKDSFVSLYYSFMLLSVSILSLYACVNLYLFVILLIPLSISSSLIRVLCVNITMSSSESNRSGNISGIYNSLTSIAKVITPILGGLVSDWVQDNYKVTFLVSFVFAFVGVVFSRIVMVRSERLFRETKRD